MKKFTLTLLALLLPLAALASSTEVFIHGLKKDLLFTKTSRAIELSRHIRVSKFGPLGQILSPDAVATYNGRLNIMSLAEENLEVHDGMVRIKDAQKIRQTNFARTPNNSTIFHEMGHAELDVFIENEQELDDLSLNYHYKNNLRPLYAKAFRRNNPHTVFHEHFGYYRSELIDFLYGEMDNIFLYNGYNKIKKSCFLTQAQRNELKDGVSLEEFIQFKPLPGKNDEFYRLKVSPEFIYVSGKDLDLKNIDKEVIEKTHLLFWGYHQNFYNFPIHQKEFVARLNAGTEFQKDLEQCRTKFWNDYQESN